MLDREQYPQYDTGPQYGESPGNMAHAPMGEKLTPPKRFWTRPKIISAAVLVLVVAGGILLISQNIAIQQRQYDVQGKVGNVWNEVDRASQLLQQDAALLITEQTEFNKWLLTQIPMNLFYHPVQILGSNANPAESVPVPRYVQPTP